MEVSCGLSVIRVNNLLILVLVETRVGPSSQGLIASYNELVSPTMIKLTLLGSQVAFGSCGGVTLYQWRCSQLRIR